MHHHLDVLYIKHSFTLKHCDASQQPHVSPVHTHRRAQSRLWFSQAADTRLLRSFPVRLCDIKVGCKLYVNERPALWFPTRSPGLFFFSTIPWLISLGETNRLCQHQEFICMQVCFQPLDRPEGGRWWSCKLENRVQLLRKEAERFRVQHAWRWTWRQPFKHLQKIRGTSSH